jgi:hypothetical protein
LKTVDQVLRHYFKCKPILNEDRELLIQAYYSMERKGPDPCFRTIEDNEYDIKDSCDIFIGSGKDVNTLALYSSDISIEADNTGNKAAYPVHVFADNPYCYFGLKLNILAYLSKAPVDRLMLYYSGGKSREFRKKEITATVLLDHYNIHYKPKPVKLNQVPELQEGSNYKLF